MLTRREANADVPVPYRLGPFEVTRGADSLRLKLENRGDLSFNVWTAFALIMTVVLVIGLLATLQLSLPPPPHTDIDDPGRFFAPQENHFGFVWILSCGLMLVLMPYYVIRIYRASLVFTFRRSDDVFLRDNKLVAPLRRIESLVISETCDPDDRYLYLLHLVYGDGRQMLLHNDYNEREIMNLANEIGSFVGTKVVWK